MAKLTILWRWWMLPARVGRVAGRPICKSWVTAGNGCATCCPPTPKGRKKTAIRRRLKNLPPRSVTLVEDETDLLLFPPLRAAWALRGQPAPVPISGANAKRVVFGVLNMQTGNRLLWALLRHRAADFQEFLEVVRWYYRSWHVAMVLDEDSSHTAQGSQNLAKQLNM